jgi:hypothetical protein
VGANALPQIDTRLGGGEHLLERLGSGVTLLHTL